MLSITCTQIDDHPGTLVICRPQTKLNCISSYRNREAKNCHITESSLNIKKKKKMYVFELVKCTPCFEVL